MTLLEDVKSKLRSYDRKDIIFTKHAELRALQRRIDLDEVRGNIINPSRLAFAKKLEARGRNEEKWDCYFPYSRTLCHRYVLITNGKIILCTVVKINRRWQGRIEKYARV